MVLGPLEVLRDGRVVVVPGGKPRAVLAVLLLHPNEPVSAERLAVALWGEDAPAGAVRTVHVYVSRLRRALGDAERLATTRAGYRLRVGPGELDLDRFERLLGDGRRALSDGRPRDAGELLRDALALWRGPALADLAFAPFAQAEVARLEELRLAAVEMRVDADLAAARHAELVAELQRLVGEHPLREHLHGQLMLALYRCGRQADALKAYRDARGVLVDELGLEPGGELQALEQAVLAHAPELMLERHGAAAASVEWAVGGRVRVPLPPTQTVGRDADLADLHAVVGGDRGRLVTVVGAGGVGKTRVAIELARAVGPRLRDGAVFVSLAALAASEHVASTIARELDVTQAPSESVEDALARHLALRELLLVLDNFEHVLDAASLVADLIAAAPGLTVLATSREPLRLRAERLFHLDPLAVVPAAGSREAAPAVALFVAAVQARDPAFTLGDHDLPAIVEVCRRLDGLPLALELAAGRVGLLSVSELATRLRSGLYALDAAPRDAPRRQRTLTATLEWSYALLDPEERDVFEVLAVFAGRCRLDAAQTVTGATIELLESVVAKNLVRAEPRDDGRRRIGLLQTVRAFAHSKLGERRDAEAVRRRHCEYYLARAERIQPRLERTGSPELMAEIDDELDNMRAAFAWALQNEPEFALRLASATSMYWSLSGLSGESENWLAAALAVPPEAVPIAVRAAALQYYAVRLAKPSTIKQAEKAARESLALHRSSNDLSGRARSSSALALVLLQAHRMPDAHRHAREALQLADATGDTQARVWALGTMAMSAPSVREALSIGERAATEHRAARNQRELAGLQTSLAYTALILGDDAAAEALSREALAAARAYGDPWVLALAQGNVGLATLFNRHTAPPQRAFLSQLRLVRDHRLDDPMLLFEALDGLAAVAAAHGHDRTAATLRGAANAATGEQHHPVIARRLDTQFFVPARARLGDQAWTEAYASGATLDRDHAIEAALESVRLCAVA